MIEVESLYTETLGELLALKNFDREHNTSSDETLNSILSSLASGVPNFVFSSTRVDLNINFEDLFLQNYRLREIGSETEELFLENWKRILNKAIINYVPKIDMWLENFKNLFKFTVQLTYSEETSGEGSESGSGDNTYYLNPVNTNGNLKVNDKNSNSASSSNEYTGNKSYTKDVLQSVWGKTRANLLEQIIELRNIYTEMLDYFEQIFMGCY